MSLPVRPVVSETDEDLLKLQEVFLAQQPELSVKVTKKSHERRNEFDTEHVKSVASTSTIQNTEGLYGKSFSGKSNSVPSSYTDGIPSLSPKTEESKSNEQNPPRKKSLFAQRLEKSRAEAKQLTKTRLMSSSSCSRFGDHSFIVTGSEAEEIHQENVSQLSSMTSEEIEQHRQHLVSQLSSNTIKFLLSRRKSPGVVLGDSSDPQISLHQQNVQDVGTNISDDQHLSPSQKKALSSNIHVPTESIISSDSQDLYKTLPINPNEAKQWLHMNVVEKEKMEWMKDLPPVKSLPSVNDPYAARFNFNGLLLPYNDEKIEVNQGLHHHGEEPERPGYTLQELMQLSRSSVQQQRILGLNTLGNVLLKFKLGIYDKVLQQNILKELLDAGIFLLLRFSMDDTSPPVVFAALTAMRNLLFNEPDEASLDFCLGCEGGLFHPVLSVPYEDKSLKNIKEQQGHEAELKDFEIIQLDVLKGALRTNLIVRLGHIMDVLKGPSSTVLDILTRIARHSPELAEAVVSCGGLLRTVRDELLTCRVVSSIAASSGYTGYGEPSSKALRLMRVLAAHSRTIANTLVDKFNIMEPVMTYVSMSSPELPHIQSLVIGGFYLWQTLLSYGLASQTIVDLFPILMRQLHFHAQLTSAVGDDASTPGHELATALAGTIERAADILNAGHSSLEAKPIFQLGKLLVDCTRKWLIQLSSLSTEKPSWSCIKMVGAALNSLAALAKCASKMNTSDSQSMLLKLESLTHENVSRFLKSQCLQYLLLHLKPSSSLLSEAETGCLRDPPNLPSLGALEYGGESLVRGLLPTAPHPILSGLLHYIVATHELFGTSTSMDENVLFHNHSLEKYVMALATQSLRNSNNWFSRQEVYMLCHLISLIELKPFSIPDSQQLQYCQLAFCVVDLIQTNDRHIISSIFCSAVLSAQFLSRGIKYCSLSTDFPQNIMDECMSNLSKIQSIYGDILGTKFARMPCPSQRSTLTSLSGGTEPALPVDWHFAPLLLLYGQYNAQNRTRTNEEDSITMVLSCLRLLVVVESLWPNPSRPLSVTARWCRLSLVFLAGSDFFLDTDVKRLLKINLSFLLRKTEPLNFSEKVPGLTSFYDLYGELLLQFSAVSYGDSLFGAFVLIPLQQAQDVQLRRMVWGEYAMVLRSLSTTIDEVGIPLENFLEPCEIDSSLLICYLEAVAKGHVTVNHCPVLYRVAVHHIATYLKIHSDSPFASPLRKRIECLGNKELRSLLLS